MSKKIEHLEMIQGVINRMAGNSFALKGWTVAMVVAIFTLLSQKLEVVYFFFTLVPIITFWLLDSYYLQQERLYRELYNKVRMMKENRIDFSMNTNQIMKSTCKMCYWNALFSKTEMIFYLSFIIVDVVTGYITYFK